MNTQQILDLFNILLPLPRSITGKGFRDSLNVLHEIVPIKKLEIPSGKKCFDWIIPKEWNIRAGYIKDLQGRVIIDFQHNPLHILNYSIPIHDIVEHDELMKHIYSRPDLPDAIPYRTSYYKEAWGFCVEYNRLQEFKDPQFEVFIDSSLDYGFLTIGEGYLPGNSDKEILLTSYLCHPAMANNELSGPIAMTAVYKHLLEQAQRKYSYRFLYLPETIGSIAYLSDNYKYLQEYVVGGIVIAMVGISQKLSLCKSRSGNTLIDRAASYIISHKKLEGEILNWSPLRGGDQRQFCSPGINLPVVYLTRAVAGNYDEYHTSLDNMSIISIKHLQETIQTMIDIIDCIEINECYTNQVAFCEPQLGSRNLYPTLGGEKSTDLTKMYLSLLGWSDGSVDILEIADKSGFTPIQLSHAASTLSEHGLLAINKK